MIFFRPFFSRLVALVLLVLPLALQAQVEPTDAIRLSVVADVLACDSTENEFANIILDKIRKAEIKPVDDTPDVSGLGEYLKGRSSKDRRKDTLLTKTEVNYLEEQAMGLKSWNWKQHAGQNWLVKPYDNARDALFAEVDRKKYTIEDAWMTFQTSYGQTYLDFSVPLISADGQYAFWGLTYRCGPFCDQKGLLVLHLEEDHWKVVDCLSFSVGSAY